jgi:hypothetical protein
MLNWFKPARPPQPPTCTKSHLIDVVQDRRLLTFTFERDGQIVKVETYAIMGFKVDALREGLGL